MKKRKVVMKIYSKFNNLKSEKQKEMINTAIKKIVQRGINKTSTNEIVQRDNISKGSLFNYFNSKKDLYLYLIDYGSQIIKDLNNQIDLSESDVFKRIEKIGLQKFYVQQRYPQVFDFLVSTKQEESPEVKVIIQQKLDPLYDQSMNKLYEDIDYSKFRKEIDIEKAIEILTWTMFGIREKEIGRAS